MPRNLIIAFSIAIVMTGITCQSLAPLSAPPPGVYLVRQTDEPLTIDGRLDDAEEKLSAGARRVLGRELDHFTVAPGAADARQRHGQNLIL